MKINLDTVPHDLDKAIDILLESVEEDDIKHIKSKRFDTSNLHHGLGRWIRNNWNLWDTDSPLTIWFRQNLNIHHPDDISAIILKAFSAKIQNADYDVQADARQYIEFWNRLDKKEIVL